MSLSSRLLVTTALALAARGEPVPDQPTWFADVQPILVANCARCHGPLPRDERLVGKRLDRYVAGDEASFDAWDYREQIALQAGHREAPVMPPTYALTDRQREILIAWVEHGAPKGQRGNQIPTAERTGEAPPATVDQALTLGWRASDGDGDALLVSVGVRERATGATRLVATGLGGGLQEVTVDTGQVGSGQAIDVVAILDDGFADDPQQNQHEVTLAEHVMVDHGARGTAPTVQVIAPNGGETLLTVTTISWTASDPDPGDTLGFDLDLLRVAADGSRTPVTSLARGLTTMSYEWDPSTTPSEDAGGVIRYAIRVTATDAGARNTRSDESDASFSVAPPAATTTLTWDDVKPVFATYCLACHGADARTVALDYFRLDKYDAADPVPPADSDLGVYEQRSLVYQRMIQQGTMPPASAPPVPAAELARVKEWILGGAPRANGPSDGAPAFTWTRPNDSTITATTTGMVTLAWSVSDPEGLPVTGMIESARINATTDQTARCDASVTGWTALPADVTTGSYAWTLTTQGYYCLRGTVTDAAMQTTTRIATRPVKYATSPRP